MCNVFSSDHGHTYFLIKDCSEIQKKETLKSSKNQSSSRLTKSSNSIRSGSSTSFEQSSQDNLQLIEDSEELYIPPSTDNNGLELFKIGSENFAICDLNGIAKKSFRYQELCEWTINSKKKIVKLKIQGSTQDYFRYVNFVCYGFRPRLVQEFIGGYVFLQLKKKRPEDATEELLKKLISNKLDLTR